MNILVDTVATYGNVPVPVTDPCFPQADDKRVFLKMKKSMNIPSASSSGDYGIGVYKFTAKNADGAGRLTTALLMHAPTSRSSVWLTHI